MLADLAFDNPNMKCKLLKTKACLLSTLAFGILPMTSCDDDDNNDNSFIPGVSQPLPDELRSGDQILVQGEKNLIRFSVLSTGQLSLAEGSEVFNDQASYTYQVSGETAELIVTFPDFSDNFLSRANIALADVNSPFSRAYNGLSTPPNIAELDRVVIAARDLYPRVITKYNDILDLYLAKSYRVIIPKSGIGSANIIAAGDVLNRADNGTLTLDRNAFLGNLDEGSVQFIPRKILTK